MDSLEVKKYIKQSLFLLMDKIDYEKISMDMIALKSGVSRRTIYRYFKNKQEILDLYMTDMVNEYYLTVQNKVNNTANIIARSFQFVSDNILFFKIAYKNNLMSSIMFVIESIVKRLILETKSRKVRKVKKDDMDYYIAFVSGGCYRMLCLWLDSQALKTPKEMTSIYRRIIKDLDNRLVKEN